MNLKKKLKGKKEKKDPSGHNVWNLTSSTTHFTVYKTLKTVDEREGAKKVFYKMS